MTEKQTTVAPCRLEQIVTPVLYYRDEAVTIYHGDARGAYGLGHFDMLLTDPQYGIGASSGVGKYGVLKWGGAKDKKWDETPAERWLLEMLLTMADKHVIWGMNYFELPPTRNYFIWDKGEGFKDRTFAECEQAWVSWDGTPKIFKRDPLACGDYRGKTHPTQKPVELMKFCILQAGNVKTILDPFCGSGTTGRAAKDLGLKAVLIDAEEAYCEDAARRMAQEVLV